MGKGYTVNSPQTPSCLLLGLGAGLDSKKAFWGKRNIMKQWWWLPKHKILLKIAYLQWVGFMIL